MGKNMEEKIAALKDVLKKADRVAVRTGAGMSAERHGVPAVQKHGVSRAPRYLRDAHHELADA